MKKLLAVAVLLLTAFTGLSQGVRLQAFTTNAGPTVTNIVLSLSSNLQPNRLRGTNALTGAVRIWAATSGTNGFWLDPATITPGAATNVAWPVRGSNTVLTTNGFEVTINAITDTNVVNTLASNIIGGSFISAANGTGYNTSLTNLLATTNAAGLEPALLVNGNSTFWGNVIVEGTGFISAQLIGGGAFTGVGTGISGLQADNISGGVLHPARMATNTPFAGAFLKSTSPSTAAWSKDGSTLTNITGNAGGATNLLNASGEVVIYGNSMEMRDPNTGWTNANWSDQTLSTQNTNVLDWFNQRLIGPWEIDIIEGRTILTSNFVSTLNSTPGPGATDLQTSGLVDGLTTGAGATGSNSVVLGGFGNTASGAYSVVVGGYWNTATGNGAFIGTGSGLARAGDNEASGPSSVIVAGVDNQAYGSQSFVGTGNDCIVIAAFAGVVTGDHLQVNARNSGIAFGEYNWIGEDIEWGGEYNFIGGGNRNVIYGSTNSLIVGGSNNVMSGVNYSFIAGGRDNSVTANGAMILGSSLSGTNTSTLELGYYMTNRVSIDRFGMRTRGLTVEASPNAEYGLGLTVGANTVTSLGTTQYVGSVGASHWRTDSSSQIVYFSDVDDIDGGNIITLNGQAGARKFSVDTPNFYANAFNLTNISEAGLNYWGTNPPAGYYLASTSSNTPVWFPTSSITGGGGGGPFSGGFTNGAGEVTASGHTNTLIGDWTVTNGTFTVVGSGAGEVILNDAAGGEAITLTVPSTVASNYTITFPSTNGADGNVLTLSGGNLAWITPPGGAGTGGIATNGGSGINNVLSNLTVTAATSSDVPLVIGHSPGAAVRPILVITNHGAANAVFLVVDVNGHLTADGNGVTNIYEKGLHAAGTNPDAGLVLVSTSGDNPTWSRVPYMTNAASTSVIALRNDVSLITTNNNLLFTGVSDVVGTEYKFQQVMVTNSSGSTVSLAIPAHWQTPDGLRTYYVTNASRSKFLVEVYGAVMTNFTYVPLW